MTYEEFAGPETAPPSQADYDQRGSGLQITEAPPSGDYSTAIESPKQSGHMSYEDFAGPAAQPQPQPGGSMTPFTDAALNKQQSAWGKIVESARSAAKAVTIKDPQWLTDFLQTPALGQIPEGAIKASPRLLQSSGYALNEILKMATPENAMLLGATEGASALFPPAAPYLNAAMLSAFGAKMVPGVIEGGKKIVSGEATPEETGKAIGQALILAAPGVHKAVGKITDVAYPEPPALARGGVGTFLRPSTLEKVTPEQWAERRQEAPEDLGVATEIKPYETEEQAAKRAAAEPAPEKTEPTDPNVVSHGSFDYRYEPKDPDTGEGDVWYVLDNKGNDLHPIRADEGSEFQRQESAKLIDDLNDALDKKQGVEAPDKAEARARKAMERNTFLGGDPERTFKMMTDEGGKEPTWQEFADALEADNADLTRTPEAKAENIERAQAKSRGMTVEQLRANSAEAAKQREIQLLAQNIFDAKRAARQRTKPLSKSEQAAQEEALADLEDELRQKLAESGGKYALRIESAGKVPKLEVRTRMGEEAPLRGEPKGAAGAGTQPRPATETVAPKVQETPSQLDKELLNRAKEDIRKHLDLPKDPVELVKQQEADPESTPSNHEIRKMVARRYNELLREKRTGQKAATKAEIAKASQPVEEKVQHGQFAKPGYTAVPTEEAAKPKPAERSHLPVQAVGMTEALGTETGKAGVRETILNARDLGLTVDQYRKWRDGHGPDYAMDADSIAARKKALGIKEEPPPEEPGAAAAPAPTKPKPTEPTVVTGKRKSFKVRSAMDDFANSAETPVATFIHQHGGIKSESAAKEQGVYEGNEALWEDKPKLEHPTHRKIYNKNGEMPDVMEETLRREGLLTDKQTMNRELEKESQHIQKTKEARKSAEEAQPETKGKIKQAEQFGKGQRSEQESGTKPVAADALSIGDKVKVDDVELKVTDVDPDGNVTLEDGRKYGVQEISNDDVVYGELEQPKAETKEPKPAAEKAEPFSTKTNWKKQGDGLYEHRYTGKKEGSGVTIRRTESGWDVRQRDGTVIDNLPTREAAMRAYANGETKSVREQASEIKMKLKPNKEGGYVRGDITLKDLVDFGRRLYDGTVKFADWSKEMVKHLGEKIAGRLKEIWENLTGGKFREGFKEGGGMRSGGPPEGFKRGYGKPKGEAPKRDLMGQELRPEEPAAAPVKRGYGRPKGDTSIGGTSVEANKRLQANPRRPDQLIARLLKGEQIGLDPADQTMLVQHQGMLQGVRDQAAFQMKNKRFTDGERAAASKTFDDADAQIHDLETALDNGRVLNKAQAKLWHNFKQKDYSQETMEDKMLSAKGGEDVTPEETAKIRVNSEKLLNAMAQIEGRKTTTGWKPGDKDSVLRDMQYDAFKAKEALDNMVFKAKMKTRGVLHNIWGVGREVLAVPRAIMASMDLSAVRRQGGISFVAHPIRSLKIIPDMMRAMGPIFRANMIKAASNDRAYFDLMQDIRERPNAPLYISSKLGLTDVSSPKLSQMEENYMSQWANHIPLVAQSQRAYVYFLNRLRADTFDAMAKTLTRDGVVTPKQADVISNFINVWTGRGPLPEQYAQSINLLNDAFFAPRYTLSRFQVLTGQPLRYALKTDPHLTGMIAKEYARALVGYGVVYGLVGAALPGIATVETDPRSTDFGKIKIGNTRVDILSGLSQPTVLLARTITGSQKNQRGQVFPLSGPGKPFAEKGYMDIVATFLRSKLAPMPAAFLNERTGQKVTGEPTTLSGEALGMITPMSGSDIYKALRDFDLPESAAYSLLALFGDSVNTYSPRALPTRKRHRSRESF